MQPLSIDHPDELIGRQTGNGYVFVRRADVRAYIASPKAAIANFFARRDLHISHPPLIPNSSSRLLIGLIFLCILAVGILTLGVQELYNRVRPSSQPTSPTRRRSGDGRPPRSLHRSDHTYTALPASDIAVSSLEEEEESIVTPPALSRRSSAARTSQPTSPQNENGSDSDEDDGRRMPHDLHYLSLPFGFGIGYSYSNISDRTATQARLDRLAAQRQRTNLDSSNTNIARSTGALPVPSTTSSSFGSDGLRSRARSFKDLCKDAISAAAGREISVISEEDSEEMSTTTTSSRWLPSLVSYDNFGSESGSGATTPTGPVAASSSAPLPFRSGAASTPPSSIALDDIASTSKGKGRYFGVEKADSSHTLVDFGNVTSAAPEVAISDPNGITRPASTPAGPLPSQIAVHPHVEQLRRQGRSETGKRVGKGTPNNTKVF